MLEPQDSFIKPEVSKSGITKRFYGRQFSDKCISVALELVTDFSHSNFLPLSLAVRKGFDSLIGGHASPPNNPFKKT
jgi:hypothetical protein